MMSKLCSPTTNVRPYVLMLMFMVVVVMLNTNYLVSINYANQTKAIFELISRSGTLLRDTEDFNATSSNFTAESFQWCRNDSNARAPLTCSALFAGDKQALDISKKWTPPCQFSDKEMASITEDCTTLKHIFPFYWSRKEPTDFRLAFVVLVARNAEQVVRLFQAIYRPWNLYCLTYDDDTDINFKQAMRNIHRCYENILMPTTFLKIEWAGFSILESTMNCMRVLNEQKMQWRYVQILSWNDFPLRTNEEMVQILRVFNGSQDSELADGQAERFRKYHAQSKIDETKKTLKKPVPPGGMVIYKGSMAVTLSREFVNFVLTDHVMNDFFNWSSTMWAPEEQYFSTIVHNLNAGPPGGFPSSCLPYYHLENTEKPYISRYQIWYDNCGGRISSGSCIFGVADLKKLYGRPELVAHKLYLEFEPAALYCLNELHFNRTFEISKVPFNISFYENLPAVRYQSLTDKSSFEC